MVTCGGQTVVPPTTGDKIIGLDTLLRRTFPLVRCPFHTASRQYFPAVQGMCKRKCKENYTIVPTIILLLPIIIIAQKYPCTASD